MIVTKMRRVGNSEVITIDRETRSKARIEIDDIVKVSSPELHKIEIERVAFVCNESQSKKGVAGNEE